MQTLTLFFILPILFFGDCPSENIVFDTAQKVDEVQVSLQYIDGRIQELQMSWEEFQAGNFNEYELFTCTARWANSDNCKTTANTCASAQAGFYACNCAQGIQYFCNSPQQ